MLAHLGFSGIGLYIGVMIAIGNGLLMAVVIVIAMLVRGRGVSPSPPEVQRNDASSAGYSTACSGYLKFRLASQAMVAVGVFLVAVVFIDRFAREEIAWSGALLVSTGIQLWPVGRKYLSGTLGKRGACTLGLALLGSAVGVALCVIYWINLLLTWYSADEFVFFGVFIAGTSIAVAIYIRFLIALFSPVRGSWLTRPAAALLGMLGFLELLVVGWCMFGV